MSLSNCEACGKLFITKFEKRCKPCAQLLLIESHKVKDFVRSHPGATLIEVYQETGVSLQTIKDLIQTNE